MAEFQKTLENIFIEAAKVFGKDESQNLLNKIFETPTTKVVETKVVEKKKKSVKQEPTKTVEVEVEKKKEEKNAKRIGRMTQTIANKLKAELVKAGVKFSDNEEKEMTGFKKSFTSYVDDLTNDDFTEKGLEKHMEDFANLNKPTSVSTTVVAKVENLKPVMAGPSNAANIQELTLKELQSIEHIATPDGGSKDVYWDADHKPNGRWVRGPEQSHDEDLTETTFRGKTYEVGDKTGRIYEVRDGKDVFVGYSGVGAFAEMKI